LGFTLVEVLVSIVSAVILSFAIYSYFTHQRRQYLQEQNMNELQANARFMIDAIGRDMMQAGYLPKNLPGITEASANRITVEYKDDRNPGNVNHFRVSYALNGSNELVRSVEKWNPAPAAGPPAYEGAQLFVLGEGVQALAFQYFDASNALMAAPGTNLALLGGVRRVRAEFTARSFAADPFTKQYRTLTLSGTWQPRNLGIASIPRDNDPPAIPAGFAAWDPGLCGELRVRWTAGTEPDLAGYLLFIGQEPGKYSDMVKVTNPLSTTYAFKGLATTKSTDATPTTYYLAVAAYDRSQNNSRLSSEISGNPSPNLRVFTAGSSDTTVNIDKPAAPTGFDVAAGGAEGRLDLGWDPSADTNVRGWRLFRSTDPTFPATHPPAGVRAGEGSCIADESTLTTAADPAVTSYADPGLTGCTTYYYKLAAIACDETLVPAYASADYAPAHGDGAAAAADVPRSDISNSTPTDVTPVSSPAVEAVPGWQRTFMSLTNPDRALEPDFDRTEVFFSTSGFPVVAPSAGNPRCQVADGTLVPDRLGVFTSGGSSGNDFVHDSELLESPGTPELHKDATYYYLAVAYDRCGNCSPVTDASKTLAVLCGDDPAGLPDFGAGSPAVTARGCATTLDIAWSEGGLKSVYDFAGYQVYRSEGQTFDEGSATQLSGSRWPNTYLDTAVSPGRFYSYAIRYMDCAYANGNGGNVSGHFPVNGLSLGEVAPDSGRLVFTGDLTQTPITPAIFEHNRVGITVRNTSAGPMVIRKLTLQWQQPTAFLKKIVIGDGATTPRETVWEDSSSTLTKGSGSEIVLAKTINALDALVPLELFFAAEDGTVSALSDMRWHPDVVDQTERDKLGSVHPVTVDMAVENGTTGSKDCGRSDTIDVPLGPQVTATAQDFPLEPTPSWQVPGASGVNPRDQVIVPGGVPVAITTHVADTSGVGVGAVRLYYLVENARTLTAAPAWDGSNYVETAMTRVGGAGSDLWKAAIPRSGDPLPDNTSVWYFIVAVDGDGNFDREPEVGAGAFQYYQQTADFCLNTPLPPVLSGAASSSGVDLAWIAPDRNADGSLLVDLGGFDVYRRRNLDAWTHLQSLGSAATSFADNLCHADVHDFTYYLTAFDRCSTTPNESLPSNCYAECQGAPPDGQLAVAPCGFLKAYGGTGVSTASEFGIGLSICAKRCNGSAGEVVWVQTCASGTADADPIRLLEDADSGIFGIDPIYYQGRSSVRAVLTDPASPTALDLRVLATDTVTVQGWSDDAAFPGGWDSGCAATVPHPARTVTIPVRPALAPSTVPNPCATPPVPAAPTNFAASSCSCSAANPEVQLSWDGPGSCPTTYELSRCTGSGCDPFSPLPPGMPIPVAGTRYADMFAAPIDATVYRYAVRSVNAACGTDVKRSAVTGPVQPLCR
jgi:hypothetical protein